MGQEFLFSGLPGEGAVIGGKHRLARMISEGGGGVVWEAADPDGRAVALKFLKWSPLKSRKVAAERFKNEFSILKSLSHPHISQIYDFGFDASSDQYFFTSELLTAGDLKAMIGEPVAAVEELFLEALRALEYLRGNHLLHLDIKPQNLLLRSGEKPSLAMIDFGLATFRAPDKPGGTANYMPPEMIVRRLDLADEIASYPQADHRSDLYSLGVTFYYILTGIQPFCVLTADGKRIDSLSTLNRHLEYSPPPPSQYRSEIPAYLDRIIMKLIARHPDDRYPSAVVAAQALQYSSPRDFAPESAATLLAYLPKEGRLVGRRREREAIEEILRRVAAGEPHARPVVCVAGGRGQGRTRLLSAIKPFAQQLEIEVSQASESGTDEALRRIDSSKSAAHLLLVDDAERCIEEPGLALALKALVRRLRLQQKLKSAPGPRLALALAVNTDRADLRAFLTELNLDDSLCGTVELGNFTAAEVAEYLAALLGEAPDASVVEQLARCTDGNPLFVTEHLEAMIARGSLFALAGRPDARTLKAMGVDFSKAPPSRSMSESIRYRMAELSEDARAAALSLACVGRPASVDELREATENQSAGRELLSLVSAGLVRREEKSGRFTFVNPLAARVIRESADPSARMRAHDAIARVLKKRRAGQEELDPHLAYGSDAGARPAALARLAERAKSSGEPLEAASHLSALLSELPPRDFDGRAAALAMRGWAFEKARLWADALASYREIGKLKAPGRKGDALRALSLEKQGLLAMRRRDLKRARKLIQAALSLLRDEGDDVAARIRLENALAGIDMRDGMFEEAIERFTRTIAVAEKSLAQDERRSIDNNELGETLLRAGRAAEALPILERELAESRKAGDDARTARLHYLLGDALRSDSVGRMDEALISYREGLKLARGRRLVELEVRLRNSMGNLSFKLGRPKEALDHYSEGLKLAQQAEGETTSVELMIGMGLAAQQMGRPETVIEYLEAALEFSGGPKGASAGLIRRYRPTILVSLGDAWYQRGEFGRALEYLGEAKKLDRGRTLTPDIRYSLYGTHVEIHLARGEIEKARRHLPTLAAIARAFPPAAPHFAELESRLKI